MDLTGLFTTHEVWREHDFVTEKPKDLAVRVGCTVKFVC